jgi:hypothetical protein
VSFAAITLYAASQRVFIVVSVRFVVIQSGNFWIQPRIIYLSSRGIDDWKNTKYEDEFARCRPCSREARTGRDKDGLRWLDAQKAAKVHHGKTVKRNSL